MTTKKKILFAGCSLTSLPPYSGFTEENHNKYHWTQLLTNHYDIDFHNIGIGGMSNHEIFVRSIEQCLYEQYDLVIIVWSSTGRLWVYQNNNNVDDFTGFHSNKNFGFNSDQTSLFHKIYYSSFQNNYIDVKHWLLQAISLASFFKQKNQPYIFVKGFDNFITDFSKVEYNNGFLNCTEDLSKIIDFENRDDDFILTKINVIKNLIIENQNLNWINLLTPSYVDITEDLADDLDHPGPISNKKMLNKIIQYIDSQQLL